MPIVYIHRPNFDHWCVLREADPGGLITTICTGRSTTLCADAIPYAAVLIATRLPAGCVCPACVRELDAGTPGAATAQDPGPTVDSSRVATLDLRGPRALASDVQDEWPLDIEVSSGVPLAPGEAAMADLTSGPVRLRRRR